MLELAGSPCSALAGIRIYPNRSSQCWGRSSPFAVSTARLCLAILSGKCFSGSVFDASLKSGQGILLASIWIPSVGLHGLVPWSARAKGAKERLRCLRKCRFIHAQVKACLENCSESLPVYLADEYHHHKRRYLSGLFQCALCESASPFHNLSAAQCSVQANRTSRWRVLGLHNHSSHATSPIDSLWGSRIHCKFRGPALLYLQKPKL